ncbi:hypothetical protein OAB00_03725 [Akkermansiaceae bacterium]|nr:hypothetical protein [Akkermansiaceae bacterium]
MIEKIYKTGGTTVESMDTFTYDEASRLISTHKGRYDVTTTHTYTLDSMPSTESFNVDNRDYSMSRNYDADNRPISHTFADNNLKFWNYDARNLVTQVMYEDELIVNHGKIGDRHIVRKLCKFG